MIKLILICILAALSACKTPVYWLKGSAISNYSGTCEKLEDFEDASRSIARLRWLMPQSVGETRPQYLDWYAAEFERELQNITVRLPAEVTDSKYVSTYAWAVKKQYLPKNANVVVEEFTVNGAKLEPSMLKMSHHVDGIRFELVRESSEFEVCDLFESAQAFISIRNRNDEVLFYYRMYLNQSSKTEPESSEAI
jgi:hypothetical protein